MGHRVSKKALGPDDVNTVVHGVPVDHLGRSKRFNPVKSPLNRPWQRGFFFSTLSFFLAFTGWFAIVPGLLYLKESNPLITGDVVKTSNIVSVLGTVFLRLAIGPILEKVGPRRVQSTLLTYGAICVMLSGLVDSVNGLYIVRFAISFVGAAFVPCQFWTSVLFSGQVVGQANAFAGGWGNLGGGFTSVFVATLITGFQQVLDDNTAWRVAQVVPGLMMLSVSIPMYMFSDDCPQGTWDKRLYNKGGGSMVNSGAIVPAGELVKGQPEEEETVGKCGGPDVEPWVTPQVWLLFVQYAACFGVELALNNSLASYLYEGFTKDECVTSVDANGDFIPECSVLGKNSAASAAALFGLMNLFARALGGLGSDRLNRHFNMRGRLICQAVCLICEGLALILFSQMRTIATALPTLILFSVFVQASEGSTYAIVPFVCARTAVVAGIVGAGGNVGAVSWATMLRVLSSTSQGYLYLGFIVTGCGFLTFLLGIRGTYILWGPNPVLDGDDSVSEAASEDMEKASVAA